MFGQRPFLAFRSKIKTKFFDVELSVISLFFLENMGRTSAKNTDCYGRCCMVVNTGPR